MMSRVCCGLGGPDRGPRARWDGRIALVPSLMLSGEHVACYFDSVLTPENLVNLNFRKYAQFLKMYNTNGMKSKYIK